MNASSGPPPPARARPGLLVGVAERVAAQRDELLLVPPLARELQLPQRRDGQLHERRRAADERVVGRERLGERPQLLLGGQPLHRLQPVHDDQPVRVLGGQRRPARRRRSPSARRGWRRRARSGRALRQRGAGDRHDRRDPGAAGEQQQVGVERGRREDPATAAAPGSSTLAEVVADPVRGVAVGGALHGDGERPAACGADESE